jgi:hypothetical protein
MPNCSQCADTGYRLADAANARTGVVLCECEAGQRIAARQRAEMNAKAETRNSKFDKGGSFERVDQIAGRVQPSLGRESRPYMETAGAAAIVANLTYPAREVGAIILDHRGEANAISIAEIAQMLWTQASHAAAERAIKAAVRELRRAGVKVGSRRTEPVGYFMIQTTQELSATVRPLLRQAVDELRTIEALTGRGFFTAELEGQMRLFDAPGSGLAEK